jgi:hypothetical protein
MKVATIRECGGVSGVWGGGGSSSARGGGEEIGRLEWVLRGAGDSLARIAAPLATIVRPAGEDEVRLRSATRCCGSM